METGANKTHVHLLQPTTFPYTLAGQIVLAWRARETVKGSFEFNFDISGGAHGRHCWSGKAERPLGVKDRGLAGPCVNRGVLFFRNLGDRRLGLTTEDVALAWVLSLTGHKDSPAAT